MRGTTRVVDFRIQRRTVASRHRQSPSEMYHRLSMNRCTMMKLTGHAERHDSNARFSSYRQHTLRRKVARQGTGSSPILLSLAIEIALKAWWCREHKETPVRIHDLLELFNSLELNTRETLEVTCPCTACGTDEGREQNVVKFVGKA